MKRKILQERAARATNYSVDSVGWHGFVRGWLKGYRAGRRVGPGEKELLTEIAGAKASCKLTRLCHDLDANVIRACFAKRKR